MKKTFKDKSCELDRWTFMCRNLDFHFSYSFFLTWNTECKKDSIYQGFQDENGRIFFCIEFD